MFKLWSFAYLTICILISDASYAAELPWKLEQSQSGYTLYSQKPPQSKFLRLKAKIQLDVPMTSVLDQFGEGDECWRWQHRCKRTKIIEQVSESEKIVHVVIDMPWPLKDREFFIQSTMQSNQDNSKVSLTLTPAAHQTSTGKYVLGQVDNLYLLTKQANDQTHLTIIRHTEFGGTVSAKVINARLVDEFQQDVASLIKLVKATNASAN